MQPWVNVGFRFRRVWSVDENRFHLKKAPLASAKHVSRWRTNHRTPRRGPLAPRLRLNNIQINSAFQMPQDRDPFSHTPATGKPREPRISETVRPMSKNDFFIDTSVRSHRRVDWPSFISLANIHFRSSSALLHQLATVSAHRSASFPQIWTRLGKSNVRITTLERMRKGERVKTARKDADDRKRRKTQKSQCRLLIKIGNFGRSALWWFCKELHETCTSYIKWHFLIISVKKLNQFLTVCKGHHNIG
jgi:hypothetical protein